MSEQEAKEKIRQSLEALGADVLKKSKDFATKLPVLGHVTWLYSKLDTHKYFSVADLETRVLPPVMLEQCKLYLQGKAGGLPMAFVSWARLDEAAEAKYLATQKITPGEWKSGDRLWLMDSLIPFGGQDRIFKELYQEMFANEDIHLLMPDGTASFRKTTIRELLEMKDSSDTQSPEPTKH